MKDITLAVALRTGFTLVGIAGVGRDDLAGAHSGGVDSGSRGVPVSFWVGMRSVS